MSDCHVVGKAVQLRRDKGKRPYMAATRPDNCNGWKASMRAGDDWSANG